MKSTERLTVLVIHFSIPTLYRALDIYQVPQRYDIYTCSPKSLQEIQEKKELFTNVKFFDWHPWRWRPILRFQNVEGVLAPGRGWQGILRRHIQYVLQASLGILPQLPLSLPHRTTFHLLKLNFFPIFNCQFFTIITDL